MRPTAVLLIIVALGCRAEPASGPQSSGPAQRVVALAPNLTEIVAFAGGMDRLVARTRFSDYPSEVLDLPDLGNAFEPDLEGLAAMQPDLVLMLDGWRDGPVAGTVTRLGARVVFLRVETVDEICSAVEIVGKEMDLPEAAAQAAALRAKRDALTAAADLNLRVIVLNGRRPLVAAGPGSWGDTLIRLAGARNALGADMARYPTLDHEAIIDLDPDAVVDTSGYGGGPGAVSWDDLRGVRAVREGRAFALADPSLLRPGPRFPEAAARLRELLAPVSAP